MSLEIDRPFRWMQPLSGRRRQFGINERTRDYAYLARVSRASFDYIDAGSSGILIPVYRGGNYGPV